VTRARAKFPHGTFRFAFDDPRADESQSVSYAASKRVNSSLADADDATLIEPVELAAA
jgi:hypothetical protein